jgi:ATP-dependent HslUV protease ATP-binding subunit HslU
MEDLTPGQIVERLDRYIVGQEAAKKAVAVALRNRYRRRLLPSEMRDEVAPKNIMMIGATGVGKTEIARQVATMSSAPFLKVEATKFTEIGYVGRDADSIVHDLIDAAITMLYDQKLQEVQAQAEQLAEERLVEYLCRQMPAGRRKGLRKNQVGPMMTGAGPQAVPAIDPTGEDQSSSAESGQAEPVVSPRRRNRVAKLLQNRSLDDTIIEIEISSDSDRYEAVWEFSTGMTQEDVGEGLRDFLDSYSSSRRKPKKVSVRDARRILVREESNRLVDYEALVEQAIERAEQSGIVFIDEIDKITGPKVDMGRDVSGEGVQRDLLPIVEGSTVMTRHGPVKSDFVLFIAAGSFSRSKPSDLIPELQGRFPLRVELHPLGQTEMVRILREPKNSLVRQYTALLATEGVTLEFTDDAVTEIASVACRMNQQMEDIGARRLQTVVEVVLEDVSFNAPSMSGQTVVIDAAYVTQRVAGIVANEDLSRYIL